MLHDGLVHSITWNDVWTPLCAKYHVVDMTAADMVAQSHPRLLLYQKMISSKSCAKCAWNTSLSLEILREELLRWILPWHIPQLW